jgi:glucose/arabinose dehydrogenase
MIWFNFKAAWPACCIAMLLTACTLPQPRPTAAPSASTLQLAEGYTAELYAGGLASPSALAWGPQPDPLTKGARRLYVAQMNGEENAGTGQIIAFDGPNTKPVVVFSNLKKPTGLAWRNNSLFVVSYRSVLRITDADQDGTLDKTESLVSDVPFNGRSLGQMDVGPDSLLYFESSGGSPNSSGYLYSMETSGNNQRIVARGLKNAYAYAWSPQGEMFTTEIGDNILNAPLDELNRVVLNADYGWDACSADLQLRDPSAAACANVQKPVATWPAHSSPTGLAWFGDGLLVALWGPTNPHVSWVNPATGEKTIFARGLQYPMDVLPFDDASVLLLDYAGKIYQITCDAPSRCVAR